MKNILCFLLLLIFGTSQGQITLENLLSTAFPSDLQVNGDGKKIAWVFNDQGVRNIWIAEYPQYSPKRLTNYDVEDGQELSALTFSPNGDYLIFIKGGAPNTLGELPNPAALQTGVERGIWRITWNGEQKKIALGYSPRISPDGTRIAYLNGGQIFLVPADGSSEGKKLFQSRGSQHSIRWSPNGKNIAFISRRSDHSFLGVYNLEQASLTFPDPSVDHDGSPVWSNDGQSIAYTRIPNEKNVLPFTPQREANPWSIRKFNLPTQSVVELWRADNGAGSAVYDALPSADNFLIWMDSKIIFPWERDGWLHLYSISEEGGKAELLTPGEGEVEQINFSLDKKSLLYTSNIGDINRRHLWKVSPAGKNPAPVQLTRGSGIEWSGAETASGFVCLRSDAMTAAWPCSVNAKGQFQMIGENLFSKRFPKNQLTAPEAVEFVSKDGMKIPAQLFLPKNYNDGQRHPAVIFFHGGSRRQMLLGFHYGQYYHHAYALNQYLASQGYLVLSVNFRSGIGYGLNFREALGYGASGASEYNDVIGAAEYLKNRKDVDSKKIGLWGGSYGGYLTALGLSRSPELFACGVDIHGVHNWNVVIHNFVPSYEPEKNPAFAKQAFESSPMNFIKGWKAPVLLIHGDDDRNVPFSETVDLVENLRDQNVSIEQLILPDEVHSFLLHKNWLKAYRATAEFFKKNIPPTP
jgi:dipeptidyl aminopeptidase/acylaminoacyl peptidase